jgi:hypothetical protein
MSDELQERKDADRIIATLARENVELRDKVDRLEDDARIRSAWLDKAKQDAGAPDHMPFDFVWSDALAALKEKRAKDNSK